MKLVLQSAENISPTVMLFSFRPSEPLHWQPGQSISIALQTTFGPEDHRFTISSAPFTGVVSIATRLSKSMYKQALQALRPGDEVDGNRIEGDFVWPDAPGKRLFLASGLGINPFYAMLSQRAHDGLPLDVTLIYCGREENLAFASDLRDLAKHHPEFSLHVMPEKRMDAVLIKSLVPDVSKYQVYLAGPSRMVDEIGAQLISAIQLPSAQLHSDWFTGRLAADD